MITLAQALKEKNRIVGEISRLWVLVENENSCWESHTRSVDVKETMKTIEFLVQKLVELKTKIGKANEGNLANMYALEECKSQMSRFSKLNTLEDVRYRGVNDDKMEVRSAEITAQEVLQRNKNLQRQCNQLQDELDAYNATHKIEFETPLT
jgi:hypothetical protein